MQNTWFGTKSVLWGNVHLSHSPSVLLHGMVWQVEIGVPDLLGWHHSWWAHLSAAGVTSKKSATTSTRTWCWPARLATLVRSSPQKRSHQSLQQLWCDLPWHHVDAIAMLVILTWSLPRKRFSDEGLLGIHSATTVGPSSHVMLTFFSQPMLPCIGVCLRSRVVHRACLNVTRRLSVTWLMPRSQFDMVFETCKPASIEIEL